MTNNYATTFEMNDNAGRGWWWGHDGDDNAHGAMVLTTTGNLTVANGMRLGYGRNDTTTPSSGLQVSGTVTWSGGSSTNANTAYSWGDHGCPNNSSNPTFSTNVQSPDFYATSWFRNSTNKTGLYNSNSARHLYCKDGNWELNCANGIKMVNSHDGSAVMYPAYKDSNGAGVLMGGSWWIQSPREVSTEVCIGGHEGTNAHNSVSSTRLMFGGGSTASRDNYYIGTNMENYGGNYTKLDLRWHTGIRMGAQQVYGGIRMYDSEDLGTVLFSVGTGDSNVRVTNNIYWSGGDSAKANIAYTHSQDTHAPSNANYITNNNQLTN
ncbi:MAG: hypothetical protein QF704_16020, partial [Anaerolineales bacterium]|nr:hypothetical protein [Anaerolineales bacterium]